VVVLWNQEVSLAILSLIGLFQEHSGRLYCWFRHIHSNLSKWRHDQAIRCGSMAIAMLIWHLTHTHTPHPHTHTLSMYACVRKL